MLTEVEVDRLASLVHRPIEIPPLALNLDIGFIHSPAAANGTSILSPALLKRREELEDPAHNRGMRQTEPSLGHHLNEIAVAQLVAHIPTDAEHHDEAVKSMALEQIIGESHERHPRGISRGFYRTGSSARKIGRSHV